jgi:hypothetical protein
MLAFSAVYLLSGFSVLAIGRAEDAGFAQENVLDEVQALQTRLCPACCVPTGRSMVMLEASTSYFAYRPVLEALQKLDDASLPLSQYLVAARAQDAQVAQIERNQCLLGLHNQFSRTAFPAQLSGILSQR